jgi:hypothetical protein
MITLDCLRALYSIDYTPVATDRNSYGIGQSPVGLSIMMIGYSLTTGPLQSNSHRKPSWAPILTCFSGTGSFIIPVLHSNFSHVIYRNFSPSLVGVRPNAVLIDGGVLKFCMASWTRLSEENL